MIDLLILGSGPAGCAAAIQARRAGLDALIIEATERMPPAPGETLHPGLEPIFARLGVLDSLVSSCSHRHQGIWVEWDEPRRFEPYGENAHGAWSGFQVDRKQLRNSLLAAAVELGTEVRYCRPQRLLIDDTGVKGVIARGCELRARWTVDATGRKAWLAQNLGLAPIRCGPPMFATFGWRTTTDPDLAGQPRIRADQRGWTWTAPLGETRTAWVGLVVGNPAHPSQSQVGTNVSWHINRECAGPGYFLLGDAAAVLDPLSSHGVLRAIMSGMLCAHLASAHRRHRLSEPNLIEHFRQWLLRIFDADVDGLSELYRRIRHPTSRACLSPISLS